MSMTDTEDEERPQEIIIVRRSYDDEEEGHHGGAWKIAFADFMTAMMCFFLVMWLINAANEQTRAALASYFNPVKLIDRNTSRKGLEDMGKGPHTSKSSEVESDDPDGKPAAAEAESEDRKAPTGDNIAISDKRMFSDPYAVLAEIAADTGSEQNTSPRGAGGQQEAGPASGASGGESYRDPFAPDFWTQQVAKPREGVNGSPDEARQDPFGGDVKARETGEFELARHGRIERTQNPDEAEGDPSPEAGFAKIADVQPLADADAAAKANNAAAAKVAKAEPAAETTDVQKEVLAKRERVAEEIRAELSEAFKGQKLGAGISVNVGEDGVLISVADDLQHGMFPVGSAVPRRELVLGMEKIAETLKDRQGHLMIHGHTDGRPFKSEDYDNWRLSTARAQAAYYMLVRGGIDEQRMNEVAGFADRKLKVPDDPYDAGNRRIEVILEVPE